MGVIGAVQVRLRAPRDGAMVSSWSLPAHAALMKSITLMMGGAGEDPVVIRARVAEALGIRDNDEVCFEFTEFGEFFRFNVKINDNISSDVLLHDLIHLKVIESFSMGPKQDDNKMTLVSGKEVWIPEQEMWAGMKVIEKKHSARLKFDGASRNNPNGPAGYGFCITRTDDSSNDELVQGCGYAGKNRSNNEMEYEGLIEGLIWATRLDLESLEICGDSELIIKQVTGEYTVKNHRLKRLLSKIQALLSEHYDLNCTFRCVPRVENKVADQLANLAIDMRENITRCNWPNINSLMRIRNV